MNYLDLAYFGVILVDLWDGANEEPVIYHGYTLTSKILVKDVLEAIRDYAFIKSPCVFLHLIYLGVRNSSFVAE